MTEEGNTRSVAQIAHDYVAHTVDLGAALWLAAHNAARPPAERLVLGVLLVKACVLALRQARELNARWTGETAPALPDVHAGIAVSLRSGGLVAPAIHHTDRLSLPELMDAMADLVTRARDGTLRSPELADPTITISSLGDRGVELVFPVIHPPQVAMIGIGRVVGRPWVVGGVVVAHPVATFSLSADHRVSDGHRGGRYLAEIDALLQKPEAL